jgi:LGFP repeat
MRAMNKRTASFSIAIAAFALIGAGCNHQNNSGQSTSSATSSSAAESTTSAAAMSPGTSAAAPSTTQIAGKNGTMYTVEGPILAKWDTLNDEQKKDLGAPYDNQKNTLDNSGVYQQFDGGVMIYRNGGPVYFVWGKIRDAWNDNQASQGKLGYPTADEVKEPDGTYKSTFEHGTITWKEGDEKATVTFS